MDDIVAPPPAEGLVPGPVPTFSVIIAAFESASVIGLAITSALDQVPPPDEVVVCDDGSSDDIAAALAPFGDRVKLLRAGHGGEASAKNHALRAASGDFVVVLDADDIFLPGRLEALGRLAALRPDLDLLTTDAYLSVGDEIIGRCYHDDHRFEALDQRVAILRSNFIFGLVAVRRSRMLEAGGFDVGIGYTTDWDCWIRLIYAGVRVGLVNRPLAHYRLSQTSMSAKRLAMARGRVATLTKTAARSDLDARERRVLDETLATEHRRVALESLKSALRTGDPDARRQAAGLAVARGVSPKRRLATALTAVAPALAARRLRREEERYWTAVGDLRLPRRRPARAPHQPSTADPETSAEGTLPVSVVIPTLGRPALETALESVLACSPGPAEVVLVDQSRTDVVAELVAATGDDRVVRMASSARGIGLATNLGLRAAHFDTVLVTHDDCTVAEDWVERAWHHMQQRPGGIVTGRVLPVGDPRFVPSIIVDEAPKDWTGIPTKGSLWVNNMAASRSALFAVGGFDERSTLRLAAEDNDLCYRWALEGRSMRYVPDMVTWHHDWRSPEQLRATYVVYARGQGAFYGKHLARGDRGVARFLLSDLRDGAKARLAALRRDPGEPPTRREGLLPWLMVGLVEGWREERRLAAGATRTQT